MSLCLDAGYLAQWSIRYCWSQSYNSLQNLHSETTVLLFEKTEIQFIRFSLTSFILKNKCTCLKHGWVVLCPPRPRVLATPLFPLQMAVCQKKKIQFPRRNHLKGSIKSVCLSVCHSVRHESRLLNQIKPSDRQGAGVFHHVTSLFFFLSLIYFLSPQKHFYGILAACLRSPLCPQWHEAHVSGMEVPSLHEYISAFRLADKRIRISSIVRGVRKGLTLWGVSSGCMTWQLHPAEPVDTQIPEIVL